MDPIENFYGSLARSAEANGALFCMSVALAAHVQAVCFNAWFPSRAQRAVSSVRSSQFGRHEVIYLVPRGGRSVG